jgi:hypothetical protein
VSSAAAAAVRGDDGPMPPMAPPAAPEPPFVSPSALESGAATTAGAGAGAEGEEEEEQEEATAGYRTERPRGFSSSSRDLLPNLHTLPWHAGLLLATNAAAAAAARRPRRSRLSLPGASEGDSPSSDSAPQSSASSSEGGAIHVDVLTLGPPQPLQHALIKFVGPRGEEIGQGVISVGSAFAASTSAGVGSVGVAGASSSLSAFLRQRLGAPQHLARQVRTREG